MLQKIRPIVFLAVLMVMAFASCTKKKTTATTQPVRQPAYITNTVAEYAYLVGGNSTVSGYGVVVGLGNNGSSEIPANVENYLITYLGKKDLGSIQAGLANLTPRRFLKDKDTAIVLIAGAIPLGAPAGTTFDVGVSALPQTQTKSLDGGQLMPSELRLAIGGRATPGGPTFVIAEAAGELVINPFTDPTTANGLAGMRRGFIPGGGTVLKSRPIMLQLRQPDTGIANMLQKRINERFGSDPPVAVAKTSSRIDLNIPRRYLDDYSHFLRLVTHLPISTSGGEEVQARDIAIAMTTPNANYDELALVWEAMGRQAIPIARTLYQSNNAPAAFYSARAGLRLGDKTAEDVILHFAPADGSPYQIPAIEELGRHRNIYLAEKLLRKLLDNKDELVRLAAYEALLKRGETSVIKRTRIGSFIMDVVETRFRPVIYATQTQERKIVVFGNGLRVLHPIFYNTPDDLVTVNAGKDATQLTVWRKIPRTGRYSLAMKTDFEVASLIKTLGTSPKPSIRGDISGLGLTYSQIIGVLYHMCSEGDIPARFVLQQDPGVQKIYHSTGTVGRPDTPESTEP